MKLILISDLHLLSKTPVARQDDAVAACFEKLYFVMKKAYQLEAPVLVAGDFFDKPRDWYVWEHLIGIIQGVQIYTVFGQHDTYKYSEKTRHATNLGVLAELSEDVHILEPTPWVQRDLNIYGCHIGQKVPEIITDPVKLRGLNVLVIHAPISIDYQAYDHHNAEDFLALYSDYDLILCGDIHKSFSYERNGRIICNTGPMIRKTVSDWDHNPQFYIYDTNDRSLETEYIPCKPPEQVLSRDHIDAEEKRESLLQEFVDHVKSKKVESTKIERNIETFCKENKVAATTQDILAEVMNE